MKNYHVINYHITNRCNYSCAYCFGKFINQNDPSLDGAKRIVDRVAYHFTQNNIAGGRINFAGGEPTLYKHLDELISYASSLGISVSIVTNGSLLTPERIRSWQGKVSCIGISIDSLADSSNLKIGRCCQNQPKPLSHWIALANAIHECNIDLKINTVVSKQNLYEDFSPLYDSLKPQKIKLFQMHLIDGINDRAKPYEITKTDFEDFLKRHSAFGSVIVAEPCGAMENSYLMINPEGFFQLNNHGKYESFGNLNTTPLSEILKKAPVDNAKFDSRYQTEDRK